MIFTARQLQEQCLEQNVDLYMPFVNLYKAFGTDSRDGLRKIIAMFGFPAIFITIVRQFIMTCRYVYKNDDVEISEPF